MRHTRKITLNLDTIQVRNNNDIVTVRQNPLHLLDLDPQVTNSFPKAGLKLW